MTAKKSMQYTPDARLAVLEDSRDSIEDSLKRIETLLTTNNDSILRRIDKLEIATQTKFENVNVKIEALGTALRSEMKETKTELKAEIGGIRHYINLIGYTVAVASFSVVLKFLFPAKFM